jgi:phenylacetate-CoA ligase
MLEFTPEFLRAMRYEKLSREKQTNIAEKALKGIVEHARKTTDFYKNIPEQFSQIEFTTKSDLQTNGKSFVSIDPRGEGVWRSTSGSSGKVVHVYWDKHNLWMRFIFMYRAFSMIGLNPLKKIMYALPDREDTGQSWLIFRNEHINLRDPVEKNIERITQFKPHILSIYPSYLLEIQNYAGSTFPFLDAISLNSENVLQHHYQKIQSHFGCPAFEEYSTVELGVVAAMCKHRQLHVFSDNIHLEIIDEQGQPVADGTSGEIVATTLTSTGMPLLRYRTGDEGVLDKQGSCPCGRKSPILSFLRGRQDDYLLNSKGEKIAAWKLYEAIERPVDVDFIFKDIFLEQVEKGAFTFYYSPDENFEPGFEDIIQSKIDDLFAEKVRIDFKKSLEIPRPKALKRKYIYRNLSDVT